MSLSNHLKHLETPLGPRFYKHPIASIKNEREIGQGLLLLVSMVFCDRTQIFSSLNIHITDLGGGGSMNGDQL